MTITTFGIGAAVTPTVVKTTFSHYTNRKPRAKKPTAHISYDQGLHLIRSFLLYASHHTVEEVQSFTSQWVPHPTWVRTENVSIPSDSITKAVDLLTAELGEDGIKAIGGKSWWQWRRKDADLKAEWIEMRSDYNNHLRDKTKSRRVMMYIHGGAYFFGSVDEHRYQLQRHARKLQARVFAPRYRLAPQFPFPCGLLDCLAAYLYLLTIHDPSEIIFAGDSAGGGMVLSLLCLLRDQGAPPPAGAVLISPWVDLTHSFPSLSRDDGYDYIPPHGFMQKPSRSWPPPNEDELVELMKAANFNVKQPADSEPNPVQRVDTAEAATAARQQQPPLSLNINGKEIFIKDQIQLYTTNQLITHPLVSPVLQPSLGGLPPLLIMVGGGELLRDEQIYVAHKAADPLKYKIPEKWRALYDPDDAIVSKYKPTPVQLQVWEDLCHVTPTLSFTRPAKFMYRSVAQFGAWALSRAQQRAIEIMDDDSSSIASFSSDEDSLESEKARHKLSNGKPVPSGLHAQIGKAGDPLPPFKNHMIREQVDRYGNIYPLPRAEELPAMKMHPDAICTVKEGPINLWMAARKEWNRKYASHGRRTHKQRLQSIKSSKPHAFGPDEHPPPSALAGRQYDAEQYSRTQRLKKSWGLGMWSSWSWKHDERTLQKEDQQDNKESQQDSAEVPTRDDNLKVDKKEQSGRARSGSRASRTSRTSARRKTVSVRDEGQVEGEDAVPAIPTLPQAVLQANSNKPIPPLVTVDAPSGTNTPQSSLQADESQSFFMPRWKTAAHLRDESKDVSDAASTYTNASKVMPDNASTVAVFSSPGVNRTQPPDSFESTGDGTSGNQTLSNSRPVSPVIHDNLGGYDTPVSRRSLERLQSHQVDLQDRQSVHSSMITPTLSSSTNGRMQPLRSSSAMAVVKAEGVISPTDESAQLSNVATPEAVKAAVEPSQTEDSTTLNVVAMLNNTGTPVDSAKMAQDEEATTPQAEARPTLYDRQDSNFVTAQEKL